MHAHEARGGAGAAVQSETQPSAPEGAESWMHVEIDRTDDDEAAEITDALQRVLRDVRESVEDWEKMHAQALAVVDELDQDPPPLEAEELRQGRDFLTWLADDHFTFLGYREYQLEAEEGAPEECGLRAIPGSGLGILRHDQDLSASFAKLPPLVKAKAREKKLLVLAKANSRSTVHRPAYLDYVGVKTFGPDGEVVGERRFLGLFSSAAYTESVTRIPVLREKVTEVMRHAGFDPRSHAGKALMDTLENYPRDELFHTSPDELAPVAQDVMSARERRQLRAFVRRDTYGRYVSVLVYLPRDRYSTAVRERFAAILTEDLGGEHVEFTARVNESTTAHVHFVVHPPKGGQIPEIDVADLERRLTEASRSWRDDFVAAVVSEHGVDEGSRLARAWANAFPEAYKEDYRPQRGSADLGRIEAIPGEVGHRPRAVRPGRARRPLPRGESRLKVFRVGEPLSLSAMLPMLTSMGVEVVDERPYELTGLARPSFIYEFGLRHGRTLAPRERTLFAEALRAVWDGYNEIDGFNQLVLAAGLTWRQATVLRAYAKYLKQGNSPFALDYIEEALRSNVDITRLLVELFESRFDPGRGDRSLEHDAEARVAKVEAVEERLAKALDDVVSLDHDRILRSYRTLVRATLRTNFFQRSADGEVHPYISFKLEPSAIPDLPEPRPRFEIFVYSPRVEGSHLRFGAVARGGLRWSDRRDDFRTEVLGLVKAQMVKNTVIVPVGAKGAFFCKQLPDPSDRDAWLAEGVACYKTFISACSTSPTTSSTASRCRRARSCGTTVTTPTSSSPPTRAPRRSPTSPTAWPRTTASGWATRSPRVARSATTTRRWASPPRAPGSRCSGTSARWASTARPRTSPRPASATCPATSSATACSAPSTPGWWRPSTTATSSSTPRPTPRRRTPSGAGSSTCRGRAGRTTTPPSSPRAAGCGRARPSRSRCRPRYARSSGSPPTSPR